jgi:hypothetical protein
MSIGDLERQLENPAAELSDEWEDTELDIEDPAELDNPDELDDEDLFDEELPEDDDLAEY